MAYIHLVPKLQGLRMHVCSSTCVHDYNIYKIVQCVQLKDSRKGFSSNINLNLKCNTLSSNRRLIRKGKIIIESTSHQKIKNHHRIYVSSENDKLWTTCFKYEISLWHHLLLNSYDMPWVNVQGVFMCCWILIC